MNAMVIVDAMTVKLSQNGKIRSKNEFMDSLRSFFFRAYIKNIITGTRVNIVNKRAGSMLYIISLEASIKTMEYI